MLIIFRVLHTVGRWYLFTARQWCWIHRFILRHIVLVSTKNALFGVPTWDECGRIAGIWAETNIQAEESCLKWLPKWKAGNYLCFMKYSQQKIVDLIGTFNQWVLDVYHIYIFFYSDLDIGVTWVNPCSARILMIHVSNDLLVPVLTCVLPSETRQRNRILDANGSQESGEEKNSQNWSFDLGIGWFGSP